MEQRAVWENEVHQSHTQRYRHVHILGQHSEKSVNFPGCRVRKRDCMAWIYKTHDHVISCKTNQSEAAALNLHHHLY